MTNILDFDSLIDYLSNCCLGEHTCGTCQNEKCLVGYCKKCLIECFKNKSTLLDNSFNNIPLYDTKLFEQDFVINTIGLILCQCRNCNTNHNENCIVNILRSTCEVILFGNPLEYTGSVLVYIKNIKDLNETIANKIYDSYLKHKNK